MKTSHTELTDKRSQEHYLSRPKDGNNQCPPTGEEVNKNGLQNGPALEQGKERARWRGADTEKSSHTVLRERTQSQDK